MKRRKTDISPVTSSNKVIRQSITVFGMKALKLYGNEVNLDRATPDLIDGLKPVHRRILWGASQMPKGQLVKAARLVGDVMGRYHPHGDASIYDGTVTLVQACTPTMFGSGNWGNIIAEPAAMRYTECRLTNFGRTGFDPDYANKEVTSFVPNYDDKDIEPVSIPFPLPVILFNGGEGIGYGVACNIPSFTPESVVEVLGRLLRGEKLKPEDFAKTLKPVHRWGGEFVNTKENRQAWAQMFTSSKASVQYQAPLELNTEKRTAIIRDWPSGLNPVKFIDWVRTLPETQEAYTSKGSSEFTLVMKKGYNSVQFEAWTKKLQAKTKVKSSYNINVTSRKAIITDGVVDYEVALMSLSVPKLVVSWLRARLDIETKSLNYRIAKQQGLIAYSKLLIYAAANLDVIFKALRAPDAKTYLVKNLKINADQATQILDLKVRQLSKLDQDDLKARLKEQQGFLAKLETWLKAPKKKVLADIDIAMEAIKQDRAYAAQVKAQKLVLK